MSGPVEEGRLFRHNYLRPVQKLADSDRARFRLLKAFQRITLKGVGDQGKMGLGWRVEDKLGIQYPRILQDFDHTAFWLHGSIGDVLSAITLWHHEAKEPQLVIEVVSQIFDDEDLQYRIDPEGGVHYLVDQEFYHASEATIAGLNDRRFGAARAALQDGLKALAPTRQSGKALIRGVFEAVESTFLVVIGGGANRLNKQAVEKSLRPILLSHFKGTPEADDKVTRMLETFNAWINEAHPYRHGAPLEQIHEAPFELAVLSASAGMAYIRLLAGLNSTA